MADEGPDLARFGGIVKARREELDLRQDQLSDRGGPSTTTLTKVENGVGIPADVTIRKLDIGLRWQPGSARRTLHGGEPEPLPENVSYEEPQYNAQSTAITKLPAEQALMYLEYGEDRRGGGRGRGPTGHRVQPHAYDRGWHLLPHHG